MDYLLGTPYFVEQEGKTLLPSAGEITSENRIFIVCDNEPVGQALFDCLKSKMSEKSRLNPNDFNNILDDTLSSCGQRTNMVNLALALFQDNGVLVAQMGKSRVLHIATSKEEIGYDSRDQVLDIYSAKARVQVLSHIADDDYIAVSLADRVDLPKMVSIASDNELDEDRRAEDFFKTLSKNKPAFVASYMIHVEKITGVLVGGKIKGLNWKRFFAYLVIAAIIAGVITLVYYCDWDKILSKSSTTQHENTVKQMELPSDTTAEKTSTADSIPNEAEPNALQEVKAPIVQKADSKPTEPAKKDTAKKESPTPVAAKPEGNNSEKKNDVKLDPSPADKPAETPKEPEKPTAPAPEQ